MTARSSIDRASGSADRHSGGAPRSGGRPIGVDGARYSSLASRRGQAFLARAVIALGLAGLASTIVTNDAVDLWRIQDASRRTVELPASLRQAVAALASRHDDGDGDGIVDAPAMEAGPPAPSGGGVVPAAIGAPAVDPWGTRLGYCAWKLGPGAAPAGLLQGPATSAGPEVSFVVVAAGPDRIFQTSCADALAGSAQGDDRLQSYSLADVALSTAGVGGTQAVSTSTAVQTQQAACAAKGKLFAGAVQGADADGCVAAAGSNGGLVTDAQGRLALSCSHIKDLVANPADGEYLLLGVPPDGSLPAMYPTRCNFTTSGGRWTLVAKYDPSAPCPTMLKPGGVCTTPAQGIDLLALDRISIDLTSVRANTGALQYLKPWSEIMIRDSAGGFRIWSCGPSAQSFGTRFASNQNTELPFVQCSPVQSTFSAVQNRMIPRFTVNLTGFRQITSSPISWDWCPPGAGWCHGMDHTGRSAIQRDPAGYNGLYYFHSLFGPGLPSQVGYVDYNHMVCPVAPVASPNMWSTEPMGGTLTNGCAGVWTIGSQVGFRGPWVFNAGPYRPWSYAVDHPGDSNYEIPQVAHLAPQPRPDQVWTPQYRLWIAGTGPGPWNNLNHHLLQNTVTGLPHDTVNDVCRFGYPAVDGGPTTYQGPGVFFMPQTGFRYGRGTLQGVSLGHAGEWLDPYSVFTFSGGDGLLWAQPGWINLRTAMVPGGEGQVLCVGRTSYKQMTQHWSGACLEPFIWHDIQHDGYGQFYGPCMPRVLRNKVEVSFASMPANVPLGLVRSYIPADIREIWLR